MAFALGPVQNAIWWPRSAKARASATVGLMWPANDHTVNRIFNPGFPSLALSSRGSRHYRIARPKDSVAGSEGSASEQMAPNKFESKTRGISCSDTSSK
jgi:hypothetical protein